MKPRLAAFPKCYMDELCVVNAYGIQTSPVSTEMKGFFNRKREMVESEVQFHFDRFKATGAELIRGEAHFIAPKAVEVHPSDGGRRTVTGDRLFLNLGSRAMMPDNSRPRGRKTDDSHRSARSSNVCRRT